MRRGLISKIDSDCIEQTLGRILKEFPGDEIIYTSEIGLADGDTSGGIHEFLIENNRENVHHAIDSNRDKVVKSPFDGCNLIIGDSIESSFKIADNSQHFLFIDANHSLFYTTADFLLYRTKVIIGGYLGFHDTSIYCKPFTDYQHIGSRENPHNYICCREAISRLGLLNNKFPGWKLIFDEADPTDTAGGVSIFQRIF
jgi:hypothetical protein